MLNIEDSPYSAVGNVPEADADNRAAIQAAIDDAYNSAIYRVWVPGKQFYVDDQLEHWSEVALVGTGSGSAIKASTNFEFAGQTKAILHGKSTSGGLTNYDGIGGGSPPLNVSRMHLRNIRLDCNDRPDSIGALLSTQQMSRFDNVRIDNADQWGMILVGGQQIIIDQMEMIGCKRGMYIRGHSFVWVKFLNIEQHTICAVKIGTDASGQRPYAIHFDQVHLESEAPLEFDIEAVDSIELTGVELSNHLEESTLFKFGDQSATEAGGAVYMIKGARVLGDPTGVTMLQDASRGNFAFNANTHFRSHIPFLMAGNENGGPSGGWPGPPAAIRILDQDGTLRAL